MYNKTNGLKQESMYVTNVRDWLNEIKFIQRKKKKKTTKTSIKN